MNPECPHCEAELTYVYLTQHVNGREYGTDDFPLDEGNYEITDSETTDTIEEFRRCPECDAEFSSENIRQLNETWREQNPERQTNRPLGYYANPWAPVPQGMVVGNNHTRFRPNLDQGSIECPNCHHMYIDELLQEMICPRCEETWSPKQEVLDKLNQT